MLWNGKIVLAATALAAVGSIATCTLWPTLGTELRSDLELIQAGRAARETKVIGKADWICFNQSNSQFFYRREFLSESRRLGGAFTQSLESCGIDNSCCGTDSHFAGAIGLVKDGKIQCVEVHDFVFYLKHDAPFCSKPDELRVARKVVIPGVIPPGRQWRSQSGETSFEVGPY